MWNKRERKKETKCLKEKSWKFSFFSLLINKICLSFILFMLIALYSVEFFQSDWNLISNWQDIKWNVFYGLFNYYIIMKYYWLYSVIVALKASKKKRIVLFGSIMLHVLIKLFVPHKQSINCKLEKRWEMITQKHLQ